MSLAAPVLSAYDPEVSAEGGVDPFSLSATYERLAERIFPFMTVRMSRPRFLTAMAVGAVVCQRFGDTLAADGKTPAWLVFEWHVVEALIRTGDASMRVPGIRKLRAAIDAGHSVGADTYLKTPRIFGFTGIYRRLAYGLDILDDDLRLSEGGHELLRAWESDRQLDGLLASLTAAVHQALKRGCTCQSKNWDGWRQITEHLHPRGARKREAAVLAARLRRTDLRQNLSDPFATAMRREMFDALQQHGTSVEPADEPRWFRTVRKSCSAELGERLDAIEAFERVCALITDAFDIIRHVSTIGGTIGADDFARYQNKRTAADIVEQMPAALDRLGRFLDSGEFGAHAEELIGRYAKIRDADSLFAAIVAHHESAQAKKPPDGKRSWLDRDRDTVSVRAFYRTDDGRIPYDYVHPYRSTSASSFLRDLKRLA